MSSVYNRGRPKKIRDNGQIYKIPEVLGEYRIRDEEDKAVYYVGISANLRARAYSHNMTGRFCDGRYLEYLTAKPGVTYDEVREHERKAIAKYDPPENRRGGGAGRPPIELVYLEEEAVIPVQRNRFLMFLENTKRLAKRVILILVIIAVVCTIVWFGKDYFL